MIVQVVKKCSNHVSKVNMANKSSDGQSTPESGSETTSAWNGI